MPNDKDPMKETIGVRLKGKIVILGIGNELRGDDAAGPTLVKKIAGQTSADVINCEETPENYTGIIKELKPDTIVIVDAVNMNAEPGSMCIVDKDKLNELPIYSTHNIPLKVFVDYLYAETKADIFLIGIQPESVALGRGISKKVKKSINYLKDNLLDMLEKQRQQQANPG